MKILLGSDHAGFEMRRKIAAHLRDLGHEVDEKGACSSGESCSYARSASEVCQSLQLKETDMGILICGTGIGISMAANKVSGIRAALCNNEYMAQMARQHNNANVLALGARVIGEQLALAIVDRFLQTEYEGGRHQIRLDEMQQLERGELL